jgi:hypothetical protein
MTYYNRRLSCMSLIIRYRQGTRWCHMTANSTYNQASIGLSACEMCLRSTFGAVARRSTSNYPPTYRATLLYLPLWGNIICMCRKSGSCPGIEDRDCAEPSAIAQSPTPDRCPPFLAFSTTLQPPPPCITRQPSKTYQLGIWVGK